MKRFEKVCAIASRGASGVHLGMHLRVHLGNASRGASRGASSGASRGASRGVWILSEKVLRRYEKA